MVIFHDYLTLPEGIYVENRGFLLNVHHEPLIFGEQKMSPFNPKLRSATDPPQLQQLEAGDVLGRQQGQNISPEAAAPLA